MFIFTTPLSETFRFGMSCQAMCMMVPGFWALSLGVKQQGHEANHSSPACAKVKKNVDPYIHSPIHLHGTVLN
jgi:hypothetical protein